MKTLKKFISVSFIVLLISISINITSFAATTENIETYSTSCILIESTTGKIIYEKNSNEKMYPASTTKIMTAILALENCKLTDIATVSYNSIHSIPYGYSYANLQLGEEVTIDQLLHVLLIPSANDAAIVLAEHIAGSTESFATMMNTKATEIGCLNTHFVNANGIHDENHYTTAYDLSLIGRYAMQNSTFRNIVSKTSYTLPITNKYDATDRVFNTTNELLRVDNRDRADNYYYKYCNGIKTGYTDAAGDCIVASSQKDGLEFIVVILGADDTENGLSGRYLDCKNLFNYAFDNYTVKKLYNENDVLKQIDISNATKETKTLDVIIQNSINVLVNKSTDTSTLVPNIEINSDLKAPITKNSIIGKITYTIDGTQYSSNLIAGSDVTASKFMSTLLTILLIIFILFIIREILKSGKKKRRKKKKSKGKNKRNSHMQDNNYIHWI